MDTIATSEFKFAADTGKLSGYGAVFNNVDLGFDRIENGAFAKSLQAKKNLPMLFQHEPSQTIGVWDSVLEDSHGLLVEGKISNTVLGRDVRTLAKDGALTGLSIGFRTIDSDYDGDVRVLKEVELFEVSVVTLPMNDQARINTVKSLLRKGEIPELCDLEFLLRGVGMSRRATKRLLDGGYPALTKSTQLTELANVLSDLRHSFTR